MTMDSLLTAYSAWLLAWMAPLWLGTYLYRSIKRTLNYSEPAVTAVPARPDYLPSIHLTAA